MGSRKQREELVPNANNPRLLMRLVGLIAAGLRRPRAIADVLEVELRTVHYYTQAAAWLGLVQGVNDVQLTRHGVALAFAEPRQRLRHYAHAVWRTPAARDLLLGRSEMPDAETVTDWIQEQDPELAESTARRRASSIRSLLGPAIGRRPSPRTPQGEQLMLPFGARNTTDVLEDGPAPIPSPTPIVHAPGVDDNLDIYTRLLYALLDNGELRTGHLRALLDEMGAADVPLGPYAEQAIRRGDAVRVADRLVATAGAIQRRDVAADPVLVALTDAAYRRWLRLARHEPTTLTPVQRRERDAYRTRFARWDLRVFGTRPSPSEVEQALARVLPGRIADSLPRAESTGRPLAMTEGPFLDHIHVSGLPIAFPNHLTAVAGGITAANALARRNRAAPAAVRLSDIIESRRVYHAGLVAPGSSPPRLVPDTFTLRLQLVSCSPAFSLLAAILILDRRHDSSVSMRLQADEPTIHWRGRALAPVLTCFAAFAEHQGWLLSQPPHSGLTSRGLTSTARAVGIASRTGNRIVLDEELFAKLQEDPEARIVYESLLPLEDALHAWLDNLTDPIFGG
ncbi:MAG: hypothetical protein CL927_08515 [Deltaproteobacteria bacterium]|nr:hypothetical protein [Deltaproteobacteria bacterium]